MFMFGLEQTLLLINVKLDSFLLLFLEGLIKDRLVLWPCIALSLIIVMNEKDLLFELACTSLQTQCNSFWLISYCHLDRIQSVIF